MRQVGSINPARSPIHARVTAQKSFTLNLSCNFKSRPTAPQDGAGSRQYTSTERSDPRPARRHSCCSDCRRRAGAHRDDTARLGHLVVKCDGSPVPFCAKPYRPRSSNRTAGRRPEDTGAEAVDVIPRRDARDHFDGATGQSERHRPQGRFGAQPTKASRFVVRIFASSCRLKTPSFPHVFLARRRDGGLVAWTARVERGPSEASAFREQRRWQGASS